MKKRKSRKKNMVRRYNRQNQVTVLAITGIVSVLLVMLYFGGTSLKKEIEEGQKRLTVLEQEIEDEEKRTEEIEALQEYMQSDEYIEKVAKEKMGLVKENEIIFKESE